MTAHRSGPAGVPDGFAIRAARPADLARLQDIERAAGLAFAEIGMAAVSDDDPPSTAELATYQAAGRCWVAEPVSGSAPVGYLIAKVVDGSGHIEQVSVHPDASGHGLGRALIDHVDAWAHGQALLSLTLTTFVDVPWNGPYYQRLGFRYLEPEAETPGLMAIRQAERASGLDQWPRACMRRGDDPEPPRRMNA